MYVLHFSRLLCVLHFCSAFCMCVLRKFQSLFMRFAFLFCVLHVCSAFQSLFMRFAFLFCVLHVCSAFQSLFLRSAFLFCVLYLMFCVSVTCSAFCVSVTFSAFCVLHFCYAFQFDPTSQVGEFTECMISCFKYMF